MAKFRAPTMEDLELVERGQLKVGGYITPFKEGTSAIPLRVSEEMFQPHINTHALDYKIKLGVCTFPGCQNVAGHDGHDGSLFGEKEIKS